MPASSETSFPPQKILYSYRKALDTALALNTVPRRILSVLYPIRVIDVRGKQRSYVDMEEAQAFIERGLHEAGLTTTEELQAFFGLDKKFIQSMLTFLEQIGHVTRVNNNGFALTVTGIESVERGVSYREFETSFKLYFEAIGNHPLSQEHFRVKMYENPVDNQGFQVIPHVYSPWDPKCVNELQKRKDKSRYGIMDEVKTIFTSSESQTVYMPVYFVERIVATPDPLTLPRYLAFSSVKGYRDVELEQGVNQSTMILNWFEPSNISLDDAISKKMSAWGVSSQNYTQRANPELGVEVVVRAEDIAAEKNPALSGGVESRLTLDKIGQYTLASEWCIWLTCDDHAIRFDAGVQNCLEWLQKAGSSPSKEVVERFVENVNKRLFLSPPITIQILFEQATNQHKFNAVDRLETIV